MMPPIAFALYAFAACLALTEANETPIGSLYAYGGNISGLPLFYGDGQYSHQTSTSKPTPAKLTQTQEWHTWATATQKTFRQLPT
jgi:hypothetical protein